MIFDKYNGRIEKTDSVGTAIIKMEVHVLNAMFYYVLYKVVPYGFKILTDIIRLSVPF